MAMSSVWRVLLNVQDDEVDADFHKLDREIIVQPKSLVSGLPTTTKSILFFKAHVTKDLCKKETFLAQFGEAFLTVFLDLHVRPTPDSVLVSVLLRKLRMSLRALEGRHVSWKINPSRVRY